MEQHEIRFNRTKILLRIIFGFALIGIGIWLLYGNTSILNSFPGIAKPNFKKFMGIFIIALMSLGIIFLIKCLLTKKPGFEIDSTGFTDRTSIFSNGKIYWEDVESVDKTVLRFFVNIPSLKVMLKNSEKPRLYSAGILDISLNELTQITKDKFDQTTANTR